MRTDLATGRNASAPACTDCWRFWAEFCGGRLGRNEIDAIGARLYHHHVLPTDAGCDFDFLQDKG